MVESTDTSPIVSIGIGYNWLADSCRQKEYPLSTIYEKIKAPQDDHVARIIKIRKLAKEREIAVSEGDEIRSKRLKKEIDNEKSQLVMFTPSGTFPQGKRKNDALLSYSGRIVADIDFDENRSLLGDHLSELKQKIADDPHVEAVCVSPTGLGLKVFVVVPSDPKNHKTAFQALSHYFETRFAVKLDQSGKDVSRGCLATYDPEIIVKPARALDIEAYKPEEKKRNITHAKQVAEAFSTEKYQEMLGFVTDQDDRERWVAVGHALKAELGDAGYNLWAEWSAKSDKWNDVGEAENQKTWDSFQPNQISVGSIVNWARKGGWKGSIFKTNELEVDSVTGTVPALERGILPEDLENYLSLIADQFGLNYSTAVTCFLGNAAFCIGGNKKIEVEPDRFERSIIWNCLIGQSGDGKTGIMMETGGQFINNLHNQWDQEYRDACRNLPKGSEGPDLKRLSSNALTLEMLTELHTKNPLGIGIFSDEILMCIEGMGQFNKSKQAALAKILTLWNGHRFDNPTMNSDRRVPNPFVCLMGGIQQKFLNKLLNEENQDSGLAARFLLTYVEENSEITTKAQRDLIGEEKQKLGGSQVIGQVLDRLVRNRETLHTGRYEKRASLQMGEFEDHLRRMRKQGTEAEHAAYPKLVTYSHRLALLLHNIREPEPERIDIRLSLVDSTIQLIQFHEQTMKCAYNGAQFGNGTRLRDEIIEQVKKLGEASAQQIRENLKRKATSPVMTQNIKDLVADGTLVEFKKDGKTLFKNSTESVPSP